ncbi:phage major capsid protein [Chryseobacterium daeguense]|uniref:phage major capsid protein n=1 Tax=Chryseobacterium daeguense TaxID=412438 RepID=UPI000413F7CE|nr:phage major capsid protein [Chryseobacterium daeguense]
MDFKYKTVAEINALSPDEQEKYLADKKTHEDKVRKDEIDTTIKEALKPLLDGQTQTTKDISDLSETVNTIEETLKSGGVENEQDLRAKVFKYVTDNHAEIVEKMKSGGKIDISKALGFDVSKAVGTVTTANGTLPVALPVNYVAERQGVPNVRLRRPYLFDVVNTFNTSEKSLAYVEAIPGEGDFAVVAEGAAKPQLDLDWVTRYVTPTKFAGWIHVTDEVLYDIPRITDMIVNYLKDKHDIFKDNQIFAYINTTATAFSAGSLAGTVVNPNIIDVVNAMQVQVLNSPNYVDEPDFYVDTVLMNPIDFFTYFATVKDAMGRNLYSDQMMLGGSMVYNGLRFISTKQVTAGNIIAFDSSKIDVTSYEPYHVEMGWINDDFIKNQRVILGESRGHIYIKEHDKRAFVKGAIATMITALTKA